jgi:hypothetical protein
MPEIFENGGMFEYQEAHDRKAVDGMLENWLRESMADFAFEDTKVKHNNPGAIFVGTEWDSSSMKFTNIWVVPPKDFSCVLEEHGYHVRCAAHNKMAIRKVAEPERPIQLGNPCCLHTKFVACECHFYD